MTFLNDHDLRSFQGNATKKILCSKEAAEYLGVSTSFLYKLTSGGRITFYKPSGKLIYFRVEDLDSWMLQNCCESPAMFSGKGGKHVK